eukprot:SM000030S11319  [mRNA]  locus=s30:80361:89469:+ [translate_table: standard]
MMDFQSWAERWVKHVQASSLPRLPAASGHPQVPPQAIAAARVARRLVSVPPHQRYPIRSSSTSSLGSKSSDADGEAGTPTAECDDLDLAFYQKDFDPVRYMLERLPAIESDQAFLGAEASSMLPPCFNRLVAICRKKLQQLDTVTEELSQQVMEHHEEMVQGVHLVAELERDLQLTSIICRNGRRYLAQAMEDVTQNLAVYDAVRQKQILLAREPKHSIERKRSLLLRLPADTVPILHQIQDLARLKAGLDKLLESGDYAKALRVCSHCLVLMQEYSRFKAVQDMNSSIEMWLEKTVEKVDKEVKQLCRSFDEDCYLRVIDAYAVLDDASVLLEKIQGYFHDIVVSHTQDVLKGFLLSYEELCMLLPEKSFRQCLHKTLEVLFDLLCSYQTMLAWDPPQVADLASTSQPIAQKSTLEASVQDKGSPESMGKSQIGAATGPPKVSSNSVLSRTSSDGDLRRLASARASSARSDSWQEAGMSSQQNGEPGEGSEKASSTIRRTQSSCIGSSCEEERGKEEAGHHFTVENDTEVNVQGYIGESEGETGIYRPREEKGGDVSTSGREGAGADIFSQMRFETMLQVRRGLKRESRALWETAARRVSSLLCSDAICSSSAHNFLQSLEWVNQFILAGEAFSGAEATGLRATLTKQSEAYFKSVHRQNIEVLRMMLERETWQQLSPAAFQSVDLAGLTGNGAPLLSLGTGVMPLNPHQSEARGAFAGWLDAGNPFRDVQGNSWRSILIQGNPSKSPATPEATLRGLNANGNVPRRALSSASLDVKGNGSLQRLDTMERVMVGRAGREEEEEEEETEELMADFIDEEVQKPQSSSRRRGKGKAGGGAKESTGELGESGPMLTGSSISALRFMDRYARLMQILQPIAHEAFKGLCQLFEFYLLSIFRIFGQRDSSTAHFHTPRLRATLTRISQGLEEFRHKPFPVASPGVLSVAVVVNNAMGGSPSPSGTDGFTPPMSPALGAQHATMLSANNLNGLREMCVASNSAMWLADMLKRWRPRLQQLLPYEALPALDHFFARTVDAVPDLREHLNKTVTRAMMNIGWYAEKIAAVRWEVKDLGMDHNTYVDLLLADFKLFALKLQNSGVSVEVQVQLREYGIEEIAAVMVEGFSRVRRCTNEGRALMSLDLQVLINGLHALAPAQTKPSLQTVENYIKAFYLPETEYLHWARTHSEYSKAQITGLINLVASTYNWKRKTRLDLLEKIESGDF